MMNPRKFPYQSHFCLEIMNIGFKIITLNSFLLWVLYWKFNFARETKIFLDQSEMHRLQGEISLREEIEKWRISRNWIIPHWARFKHSYFNCSNWGLQNRNEKFGGPYSGSSRCFRKWVEPIYGDCQQLVQRRGPLLHRCRVGFLNLEFRIFKRSILYFLLESDLQRHGSTLLWIWLYKAHWQRLWNQSSKRKPKNKCFQYSIQVF